MELVERLKDDSQWKIVRGVPALVPFTGPVTLPDGTVKQVNVGNDDLEKTLANYIRKFETRGMVGVITPGHRKPFAKETEQPSIWGHPMNPRIGTWGPENKIALLVDEYYYPNHWDEYCDSTGKAKYPFRSPEYYASTNELTGLAVLIRDPKLDMGMVTFARTPEGDCLYFAMDGPIDPTQPPEADPQGGTEGGESQEGPEGVPEGFYGNFMKCMQHCSKGAEGGMQTKAAHMQRTEPVSTPAVTTPATVTPVATPDTARDQQAIQFARMQGDITALQTELAAAKTREADTLLQFSRADCEKRCAQLEYEGYSLSEGWKEEVAILMSRDAAGRESYCQYVRGHHKPTGNALMRPEHQRMIETVESPILFRADDPDLFSREDLQMAQQFMRDKPGLEWSDYEQMVQEAKAKKKKKAV